MITIAIKEKAIPLRNMVILGLSNLEVSKLNKQIDSIVKDNTKRTNLIKLDTLKFFICLFFVCYLIE